jgi:DNA (cytosine-5)-methyltransferase 3A
MAGKMKGSSTKCGKDVTTLEQYLLLKNDGFLFEGQSYLFWEFVRVWKIVKPKYFMLENVKISRKWLPMFNEAMGVEGILINSNLVSFQNRVRFYWSNIPNITQLEDRKIYLKDSYCKAYDNELVVKGRGLNKLDKPRNRAKKITEDKCPTLLREQYSKPTDSIIFYMPDGIPRYPTRRELEGMQTVPYRYTKSAKYNDAAAMLGNGFTIDVIAHIFSFIPGEKAKV